MHPIVTACICTCVICRIYSQRKSLESSKIDEMSKARWLDWSTCVQLLLTVLLYFSYDVFNGLPIFPPIIGLIRLGSFGTLDIFIIGLFTDVWCGASNT